MILISLLILCMISGTFQKSNNQQQHILSSMQDDMEISGVRFDTESQIFSLTGHESSYIFRINPASHKLEHLYWGPRISRLDDLSYLSSGQIAVSFDAGPLNSQLLEYSDFGSGDYRIPGFQLTFEDDGSSITDFRYHSHRIVTGQENVERELDAGGDSPHFRARSSLAGSSAGDQAAVECLIVTLKDPVKPYITLDLRYTLFPSQDSITRSAKFSVSADGDRNITLNQASSALIDLPPAHSSDGYHLTQLSGSWARERHIHTRPIGPGLTGIESRRGVSSHQHNPFVVVTDGEPSEIDGDCFAVGLVYAGNHQFMIEKTQSLSVRLRAGIHPDLFQWELAPGESFETPEVVLTYSKGTQTLSQNIHSLIRNHLLPSTLDGFKYSPETPRPVLVNSWEAMYFNCTEQKILSELVYPAKELGIDMVVVDDGWFRGRHDDKHALGDWFVDRTKFPHGLGGLADKMQDSGVKLGIWVEPEMISPGSHLIAEHPDWVLQVDRREKTQSRNQYVLDISRREVQNFIIGTVSRILRESKAGYCKWDFNRHLTEVFSSALPRERRGELYHRWILGLYRIFSTLTNAFPNVLFESCSGGGGRYDLAFMYYTPQIWASDMTDAAHRIPIQKGSSLFYPANVMASHVSAVPNHQVHRTTGLGTRHVVAMSGILGYELDLSSLNQTERSFISTLVQFYKSAVQPLVLTGQYYRLSPFQKYSPVNDDAVIIESWSLLSTDKSTAVAFAVLTSQYDVVIRPSSIRMKGLDPSSIYKVTVYREEWSQWTVAQSMKLHGSTLMNAGVVVHMRADYDSLLIYLEKC